jgi:hypothetical protein
MRRLANFWGTAALLEHHGKCNFNSGGTEMLRKTLITLTAVYAENSDPGVMVMKSTQNRV